MVFLLDRFMAGLQVLTASSTLMMFVMALSPSFAAIKEQMLCYVIVSSAIAILVLMYNTTTPDRSIEEEDEYEDG